LHPEGLETTFYSKERNRDIEIRSNKPMDFHSVSVYTLVIQLSLWTFTQGAY